MRAKILHYYVCPDCGKRRAKRRGEPCGYCDRERKRRQADYGEATSIVCFTHQVATYPDYDG